MDDRGHYTRINQQASQTVRRPAFVAVTGQREGAKDGRGERWVGSSALGCLDAPVLC